MDMAHHSTTGYILSSPVTAIPFGRILHFVLAVSAFLVASTAPAQADPWSILLNGKAMHLEKASGTDYNEENWGAGIQYDFKQPNSKWIPFVTVSGFKDSNGNPSYYAGGGSMRRFAFSEAQDSIHLDAGVVAFLMTRKNYLDGAPFLGVLPVVSLGTDRVALNVTYIPKIDPKLVPIIFLQVKIGIF